MIPLLLACLLLTSCAPQPAADLRELLAAPPATGLPTLPNTGRYDVEAVSNGMREP
jgi:hypothetical protein